MTSWLITQDSRFAAAVALCPMTNFVTMRLNSNISEFVKLFVGEDFANDKRYHSRSPIMHTASVVTPTLNICGDLDRCTPPEEARQFHSALIQNGVESELIVYPKEGHGIRQWPASIDYVARVVDWFSRYLVAQS